MATPTDDTPHGHASQRVVELAVNLDDTTGELVGETIDRLIQAGALDAWATPITMKKGRPAITLSALVKEDDQAALAGRMLALTGGFGVRYRVWERMVLDRDWHDRPTRLGRVKLKAGSLDNQPLTVKPEHDDVVRLANQAGVSVRVAQQAAQAAADALLAELQAQAEGGAT